MFRGDFSRALQETWERHPTSYLAWFRAAVDSMPRNTGQTPTLRAYGADPDAVLGARPISSP